MIPLIIGGAMMAGGTGMQMFGQNQRDRATRRALGDYRDALSARDAANSAANGQEQGALYGLAMDRQQGIGQYISQMRAAQFPGSDGGFQASQAGALSDLAQQTQGVGGSEYAYQGLPRTQAEGMQGAVTGNRNKLLADAMLTEHQNRQIESQQQMAGHQMALGDLLRNSRGKSMMDRFQLAKALRDLDWQRKTAAMQGNMDDAMRVGQTAQAVGGMGAQAGSMLMSYGLSGSGSSGAPGQTGTRGDLANDPINGDPGGRAAYGW